MSTAHSPWPRHPARACCTSRSVASIGVTRIPIRGSASPIRSSRRATRTVAVRHQPRAGVQLLSYDIALGRGCPRLSRDSKSTGRPPRPACPAVRGNGDQYVNVGPTSTSRAPSGIDQCRGSMIPGSFTRPSARGPKTRASHRRRGCHVPLPSKGNVDMPATIVPAVVLTSDRGSGREDAAVHGSATRPPTQSRRRAGSAAIPVRSVASASMVQSPAARPCHWAQS